VSDLYSAKVSEEAIDIDQRIKGYFIMRCAI